MLDQLTQRLLSEAAFIETYTQYYRRQLEAAARAGQSDAHGQQCIELCREALQMIGDSKKAMMAALAPLTK